MTTLALTPEKDFAGRQSIGQRSGQEDSYAFSSIPAKPGGATGLLLIVADGMGGHAAGGRASETAVRHFVGAFHRGGETMGERFGRGLDTANDALAAAINADPDHLEGMGTTLLALAITPLGLEWLSVGDSPLYLFRKGDLRRMNADHSFRPVLQDMVARNELTPDQAANSSLRNRLRSALVGAEIPLVDVSPRPQPLRAGDVILAGSDGLQTLSDEAIAHVLAETSHLDAGAQTERLIQAVLEAGVPRQDNITATILRPAEDWLLAAFSFAPPKTAVKNDDAANTTQRLVPRIVRPSTEDAPTEPAS